MLGRVRTSTALLACLLAGLAAAAPGVAGAPRNQPLVTAITDAEYGDMDYRVGYARTRAAGATAIRFYQGWNLIAPASKPANFNAADPADPAYNWAGLDSKVVNAVAAGLEPILSFSHAPGWAQTLAVEDGRLDGNYAPDPNEFGAFATAVAARYSGRFRGLPRVRYYQAWNEPNLGWNLMPQYNTPWSRPVTASSQPVSPHVYLPMLNAFTAGVRAVNRDNLVVGGGLAPFGRYGARDHGVAPLPFMRTMLCLTSRDRPQSGCNRRASFDAWGHDPYTQGGPETRPRVPGNVTLGNLGEVRRTLTAASRAGRISSTGPVRFWVLEFGWNTKPPFARGVPTRLHARWVAEALYRMWRDGVSLVTWYQLRDAATYDAGVHFQAGLYTHCARGSACDRPKLSLGAFRFPFVAYKSGPRVSVWARTPAGKPGSVTIEQRVGRRWQRLARLPTNRHGIVEVRLPRRGDGDLRATSGTARAVPFSLTRPPNRVIIPAL